MQTQLKTLLSDIYKILLHPKGQHYYLLLSLSMFRVAMAHEEEQFVHLSVGCQFDPSACRCVLGQDTEPHCMTTSAAIG